MASERASQHSFFGVSALLFAASAALTIAWCESMSAMGEMPMPGGWTMSMAWIRMPGQTWPRAAASLLGMWVVMMVAMMLPSLVPMLWRYRQAVGRPGETRLGRPIRNDAQSDSRGCLTPSPHNTPHAGPHGAFPSRFKAAR
jgi:predicted metal-binding membrane protein